MRPFHRFACATLAAALPLALGGAAVAEQIELDFFGNAGFGILPGNEIGANTTVDPVTGELTPSDAFGDEVGEGLVFDTETNVLAFDFEFEGLDGGLFDAASGIHLHLVNDPTDPLNSTGPIVFNLNSGTDAAVTLTSSLLDPVPATTSGRVTGTAVFTDEQAADLLAGNYYLNIHSGDFTGGNIRANLVPEPASLALLGLGGVALASRRVRRRV